VERVAPGHCTSELGFAVFMERFKERFDRAGLGATIALPQAFGDAHVPVTDASITRE
jgi:hypothetical protein